MATDDQIKKFDTMLDAEIEMEQAQHQVQKCKKELEDAEAAVIRFEAKYKLARASFLQEIKK